MFVRNVLAVVAAFGLCGISQAAHVKSFVVRCVDRQEVSADDIFLAGVADNKPVAWGEGFQKGTSVDNSINMDNGESLMLDAKSLGLLNFQNSLKVSIYEKDVVENELIGEVTISAEAGKKSQVFKNENFEYHIEYEVE